MSHQTHIGWCFVGTEGGKNEAVVTGQKHQRAGASTRDGQNHRKRAFFRRDMQQVRLVLTVLISAMFLSRNVARKPNIAVNTYDPRLTCHEKARYITATRSNETSDANQTTHHDHDTAQRSTTSTSTYIIPTPDTFHSHDFPCSPVSWG